MNLYLIKYNNYYNRIIKKEGSLSDYLAAQYYSGLHIDAVSFNPNDGITTSQIVNFVPVGDYVIITDVTGEGEAQVENIMSRWFVTEAKRERTGQYMLMLRRDVIVDKYNEVITAPAYIEKATLPDTDPMIFNKERITLNQIKKTEHLLKDPSQCAWVVGYIPRDSFSTSTTITSDLSTYGQPDIEVNGIRNWEFFGFSNLADSPQTAAIIDSSNVKYNLYGYSSRETLLGNYKQKISISKTGPVNTGWIIPTTSGDQTDPVDGYSHWCYDGQGLYLDEPVTPGQATTHVWIEWSPTNASSYLSNIMSKFSQADFASLESMVNTQFNTITQQQASRLALMDGKIIKDTVSNVSYTISVTQQQSNNQIYNLSRGDQGVFDFLENKLALMGTNEGIREKPTSQYTLSNETFRLQSNGTVFTITLSQFSTQNASITIDGTRTHANDAPYDIFCMPYTDDIQFKTGANTFLMDKRLSVNLGINIGLQTGSSNIFDVQLLPYCPINFVANDGVIDFSNYASYNLVKDGNQNVLGVLFWVSSATFNKNIEYNITINNPKVENQCDLYRFCSPNYENAFDFNAAMNNGLDIVKISCTYRPFDPFIHVYPRFKGLYGNDFDDSRGLICGGDYSLPQMTSSWAEYKMSNKSYLSVFDARVSSYTSNKDITLTQAENMVISKLGDSDTQQSLGNIKAMPSGLSRGSALNANNKLFPFVEYYTCSDEEKAAFTNKIYYEGMTVKRIGQISQFLQPTLSFIKCKIIRLDSITEDYHYANEVAKELQKGVYI